ncbi:uncharacterized protein NMK_1001 [Novimethylophilus kurashikiensis]|uniref:Uncharacterized protein n=1 Tax=Novimethylophilus kurashikiensis TaxID=1825523 RepID=A0A2R5F9Z0_9PROT|nr:hypothetical protein [Novimethylophilus kurashikiensis]GBG13454.1 uncharacterized protein NMK_1001 [Novimethylophilus kurashikiensis]
MTTAEKSLRPPLHPLLVLVIAMFLPGVGQVINNTPTRGLMMLFFMLMLGVVTFNLAAPGVSIVGKFAGGLFIYALSVMDAYYWAKYRWEKFRRSV